MALSRAIATEFSGDHRRTSPSFAVYWPRQQVTLVLSPGARERRVAGRHLGAAERHLEAHRLNGGRSAVAGGMGRLLPGQVELARGDLAAAERPTGGSSRRPGSGSAPLRAAGVGSRRLA